MYILMCNVIRFLRSSVEKNMLIYISLFPSHSFFLCLTFPAFLSSIQTFLSPHFRLKCRPGLMVYRSSQSLLSFPSAWLPLPLSLSLSPATWYGCQAIDGCVRQSHESRFYSEGLPYKPTAILGYWTNKLWASRKSISCIDKHRRTHDCMYAHTMKRRQGTDTFLHTQIQTCLEWAADT